MSLGSEPPSVEGFEVDPLAFATEPTTGGVDVGVLWGVFVAPVADVAGLLGPMLSQVQEFARADDHFNRVVARETRLDGRDADAGQVAQFAKGIDGPFVFNADVLPHVVRLLFGRGPSPISRLIVAVNVNAVDGMTEAWSLSDIGDEVLKIKPSLAELDAPATVVFEVPISGTQASGLDVFPRVPKRMSGHSGFYQATIGGASCP